MGDSIEPFLVRVAEALGNGTRRFLGTGFQVAPGVFATCRHVVCPKDQYGVETHPKIRVGLPDGSWHEAGRAPDGAATDEAGASVTTPSIHLATGADLAVIRLDSEHCCTGSVRLCRDIPRNSKDALDQSMIRAPGYCGPYGTSNEGRGFQLLATFDDAVSQARVQIAAGINGGMSGCPVLLDCHPGVGDTASGTSFVIGVLRLGSEFAGNSSWTSVDGLITFLDRLAIKPHHGCAAAACVLAANALATLDRLGDPNGAPMAKFLERAKSFVGRDWLLKEIDAWALTIRRPILRIEGGPGVGKSAMAAKLVDRSRGNNCESRQSAPWPLAAHHVCDSRGNHRSFKPGPFARHVASQLAWRSERLAKACFEGTPGLLEQLRRAGDQPKATWRTVLKSLGPLDPAPILLVDGLDVAADAAKPDSDSIIDLLAEALKAGPGNKPALRLVVTGQQRDAIQRKLSGHADIVLSPGDERQVKDVAAFAAQRLGDNHLASRLGEQARGNYYFVQLLLDDLSHPPANKPDDPSDPPPSLTKPGLVEAVRKWLEPCEQRPTSLGEFNHDSATNVCGQSKKKRLPTSLSELYHDLLTRHFPDADGATWQAAHAVLALLLAAADPLPLPLLHAALAKQPTRALTAAVRSLSAFAPTHDGLIAIDHDNVRQWLQAGRAGNGVPRHEFVISEEAETDAHGHLCDAIAAHVATPVTSGAAGSIDDYITRHHPYHLACAGRLHELGSILLSGPRLRDRLRVVSLAAVLRDYSTYLEHAKGSATSQSQLRVRDALSLSESVLRHHRSHLTSQLAGRLADDHCGEIRSLLKSLADTEPGPWLRPLEASLTRPDEAVERGLPRGDRAVTSIATTAPTAAEGTIFWAGFDGTVFARAMKSWAPARNVATHDGGIAALAVHSATAGGGKPTYQLAAAGFDGTLRLCRIDASTWDAKETASLSVPGGMFRALACISKGGSPTEMPAFAVGDQRGVVSIWKTDGGPKAEGGLHQLGRHEGWVNALTVVQLSGARGHPIRWLASGGADGVVRLWSLGTPGEGLTLGAPGSSVCSLLVSPWLDGAGASTPSLLAVHITGEVRGWSLTDPPQAITPFRLPCAQVRWAAGGHDWNNLVVLDRGGHVQAVSIRPPHTASVGFFADGLASQVCVVPASGRDGGGPSHVVIVGDHAGDVHRLSLEPGTTAAAAGAPSRSARKAPLPPPPRR